MKRWKFWRRSETVTCFVYLIIRQRFFTVNRLPVCRCNKAATIREMQAGKKGTRALEVNLESGIRQLYQVILDSRHSPFKPVVGLEEGVFDLIRHIVRSVKARGPFRRALWSSAKGQQRLYHKLTPLVSIVPALCANYITAGSGRVLPSAERNSVSRDLRHNARPSRLPLIVQPIHEVVVS